MKFFCTLLMVTLLLSACTSNQTIPTSYAPVSAQNQGGYKEFALSKTSYHVTFIGNQYTSAEYVKKLVLRRAAELTLSHHYTYFGVINELPINYTSTHVSNALVNTVRKNSSDNSIQAETSVITPSKTYEQNMGYSNRITIEMSNIKQKGYFEASVILSNFQKP
jgi:hypothetical protein